MKVALIGLLTTAVGLGWFGRASTIDPLARDSAAPSASTCPATVECTPDGRCIVRCTGAGGENCTVTLERSGDECRVVDCESSSEDCKPCTPSSPACGR